jgi:hypothetical protein
MTYEEKRQFYMGKVDEVVTALTNAIVDSKVPYWLAYAACIAVAKTIEAYHPDVKLEMTRMAKYFETGVYPLSVRETDSLPN